jgi:hypothetical protein
MERLDTSRQKTIGHDLTEKIGEEHFVRYLLQLSPEDLLCTSGHHKFEVFSPGHMGGSIRKDAAPPKALLSKEDSLLTACLQDFACAAFEEFYVRRRQG